MAQGSRFYSVAIRRNPGKGKDPSKGKKVGQIGVKLTKAQALATAQTLADARVLSKVHNILVEAETHPSRGGSVSMPASPAARVGNPRAKRKAKTVREKVKAKARKSKSVKANPFSHARPSTGRTAPRKPVGTVKQEAKPKKTNPRKKAAPRKVSLRKPRSR